MNKNDGGPAFPVTKKDINNVNHKGSYKVNYQHGGMSLLKWYAGQALVSRKAHPFYDEPENIGKWCFKVARAMLAEGDKPENK